ncbi:dynamin family protein [Bhargavaea massiliensis]|uniref:dynamin family protein n=1 Tax=Bhargavaea massiliensis TaxID=2697500 RepID=UPI001BCE8806|nr:dynamin family protein [Bhargavaea massiliensis]
MSILDEKVESRIENLYKLLDGFEIPGKVQSKLEDLKEDIQKDQVSVVVVGEFKNGKSTLINSLIGEEVMPSDVTPTTAVLTTIKNSTRNKMIIHRQDGMRDSEVFNDKRLLEFTVGGQESTELITAIHLEKETPYLESNILLVDTPGLNDLSSHRAEVSHGFIPRADILILVVALNYSIKKTEFEFIQHNIAPLGHKKVLVVANFQDLLESEEEFEEAFETTRVRLQNAFGNENAFDLIPLSAKDALYGQLHGEADLVDYSGLSELKEWIKTNIKENEMGKRRELVYRRRFEQTLFMLNDYIDAQLATLEESIETIKVNRSQLVAWKQNYSIVLKDLEQYILDRENEIYLLINKSLSTFVEDLRTDIYHTIEMYNGNDLDNFANKQIPKTIERRFAEWIRNYQDSIIQLLAKVEREVAKGLLLVFEQQVNLPLVHEKFNVAAQVGGTEIKASNTTIRAGALVGGASTIALLVGAPLFMPVLGLVAMPFLTKKMNENQLNQLKPHLFEASETRIHEGHQQLKEALEAYINRELVQISSEMNNKFNDILTEREYILERTLWKQTEDSADIDKRKEELHIVREKIKPVVEVL